MEKLIKIKSKAKNGFDESKTVWINPDNIDFILEEVEINDDEETKNVSHVIYFNGGDRYVWIDDESFERLISLKGE